MKTMMKLGLGLIAFGLVFAILASFAIRVHGEAKVTVRAAASVAAPAAVPSATTAVSTSTLPAAASAASSALPKK